MGAYTSIYSGSQIDTRLGYLNQDLKSTSSPTFLGVKITNESASKVLYLDASNNIRSSSVTAAELSYLSDVTSNIQNQLNSKASDTHTHGNITSLGAIGSTANLPLITTADGVVTVGSFGNSANTFCVGNDSRLSDARNPTSHTHGNITNTGAIGTTSGLAVVTTTSGVLTTGTVPIASGGTGATTAADALTNLGLTATAAELNYIGGVTSNIQTQLNNKAPMATNTTTLPATIGWYRIATSAVDIVRCAARFELDWIANGCHGAVIINAGIMYGLDPTLNQLQYVHYGINALTKVRIVYHITPTGNYAYLEIYLASATAITLTTEMFSTLGWSLITPIAGSIPTGYTSQELAFVDGITTEGIFSGLRLASTVETGTAPLAVASTTACTNLNADLLDGNHASAFATSSHTHGNITNDGAIGTVSDLPVFTTTSGVLTTKTVADARTALGLGTNDSPTFSKITSKTPTGVGNALILDTTDTSGSGQRTYISGRNNDTQQWYIGYGSSDSKDLSLSNNSANGNLLLRTNDATRLTIDKDGYATFASRFACNGETPQAKADHIADANGTIEDITSKFNTLLAVVENYGMVAKS